MSQRQGEKVAEAKERKMETDTDKAEKDTDKLRKMEKDGEREKERQQTGKGSGERYTRGVRETTRSRDVGTPSPLETHAKHTDRC